MEKKENGSLEEPALQELGARWNSVVGNQAEREMAIQDLVDLLARQPRTLRLLETKIDQQEQAAEAAREGRSQNLAHAVRDTVDFLTRRPDYLEMI